METAKSAAFSLFNSSVDQWSKGFSSLESGLQTKKDSVSLYCKNSVSCYISDHFPIMIEENTREPHVGEIRYLEHRANWNVFTNRTRMEDHTQLIDEHDIDELVTIYRNHIIKAANIAIPKSNCNPRPKKSSLVECRMWKCYTSEETGIQEIPKDKARSR